MQDSIWRNFLVNQMQIKLQVFNFTNFPVKSNAYEVTEFILTKFSVKSDANQVAVPVLVSLYFTMLQKLSKCEVKAWLLKFENLTVTQILREIKFRQIQTVQKCNFGNFRDSEFWFLVNLSIFQVPNLPKFKFQSL